MTKAFTLDYTTEDQVGSRIFIQMGSRTEDQLPQSVLSATPKNTPEDKLLFKSVLRPLPPFLLMENSLQLHLNSAGDSAASDGNETRDYFSVRISGVPAAGSHLCSVPQAQPQSEISCWPLCLLS